MSTNVPEHLADWEAQRERLSALLDGQLSAAESAALRVHVSGCARCTDELEALRRVVGALRALPQPTAPRSFALPLTTALPAGAPAQLPIAAARARRLRWAAVTQWAGAVAACFGFVILSGTFLLGSGYAQKSMANFGAARHEPSGAGITSASQPPATTATPDRSMDATSLTPRAATGSAATATLTPAPTAAPTERTPLAAEPPDARAAARTTGVTLMLGGLAALVVGWGARRRGPPR